MRAHLVFLLCCSLLIGCKSASKMDRTSEIGHFPKHMAGVWEADANDGSGSIWGIKFECDGSITKIVHMIAGPILVEEGGVYRLGPDPNTSLTAILGLCKADYIKSKNQLDVTLNLDYFKAELPQGVLEGKAEDYFSGSVPAANSKIWKVKWWNYGWLEGATPPDKEYIRAHPAELIFRKILN